MEVWQNADCAGPDAGGREALLPATMRDLSLTGVRFCCARPFSVGAAVWLRLRLGCQTHYVKGIVRRAAMTGTADRPEHECGVEFIRCPQSARFAAAAAPLLERFSSLDTPAKPGTA